MAALKSLAAEPVSADMQTWLRRRDRVCLICGDPYESCVCRVDPVTFTDETSDDTGYDA